MGVFFAFFFLTGMNSCDHEQTQELKITTKYTNQHLEILDLLLRATAVLRASRQHCLR